MEDHTTNIDSTVLPLLSICSLTSEYRNEKNQQFQSFGCSLLKESEGLPDYKSPQLLHLIDDLQESFEKETNILLKNEMSENEVQELFERYKQYLLNCYISKSDYYDGTKTISYNNDNEKSWVFDESISCDNLSTSNTNSFSLGMSDFDFEYAAISTSSNATSDTPPHTLEFDGSQLCNGPDYLYPDYLQIYSEQPDKTSNAQKENTDTAESPTRYASNLTDHMIDHVFFHGKRKRLTRENKALLDTLFSAKNFPNTAERKLIAAKCNLSPSQVRIWFTNKRARCKDKV